MLVSRTVALARAALFALILFAIGVGTTRAQQTALENYAGFEGRTVARVDIAAGPSVNVGKLLPLIQQKANKPFSVSAIRESLQALRGTKQFSQVQFSVEPEQNGLNLLFVLEPAFSSFR